MSPLSRLSIAIYGEAQGIPFRSGALSEARKLGLRGWVKNETDDSIRITAEGEKEKLEEFLAWCQHGPEGTEVKDVEFVWEEARDRYSDFRVRTD